MMDSFVGAQNSLKRMSYRGCVTLFKARQSHAVRFLPIVMKSPGLKPIEAQNARSSSVCVPYWPLSICQMSATLRTNFLTSQSRRTKIKTENAFCSGSTQIKGRTEMRKERTLIRGDGESVGYTFFFQIANDVGRRACCVKII